MKCRQFVDFAQSAVLCRHSDADVPSVCTSLYGAKNCEGREFTTIQNKV